MMIELDKSDIDLMYETAMGSASPYNPYSSFGVRAAVMTLDNAVYAGVNVENANYTLTKHAEETAITRAIMGGAIERHGRAFIKSIMVICASDSAPCGGCRQFIHEFIAPDAQWIGINSETGERTIAPFSELLPYAFGPADLGIE